MRQHVVTDRMHQVRLAKTHTTVEEQRIVGTRWGFSHRTTSGVRELVRGSNDERVEDVAGTQASRLGWGTRKGAIRSFRRCRPVGFSSRGDRGGGLRSFGSTVSDESELGALAADFGQGLGQDPVVVLCQPVDDHRVGDPNRDLRPSVAEQRGLAKPGVVAIAVDFGLDPRKHLVPDGPAHRQIPVFAGRN